jgi:hypothetical protein
LKSYRQCVRHPSASEISTAVSSLLARATARVSFCLGDYDDRRLEIGETYEAAKAIVSATLGAPVEHGLEGLVSGPQSDASRAVVITAWSVGKRRLVTMLTTHDAGTLTFLELELVA